MSRLVLYTKDGCPYCSLLKMELTKRGFAYETIDLSNDADRNAFYAATGTRTVPQLVRLDTDETNGIMLGGYSDVAENWDAVAGT